MVSLRKILLVVLVFMVGTVHAQTDVTKFLNIPIDGSKEEFIQKLLEKGFTRVSKDENILQGEFNGTDVLLNIVTNKNKVWRLVVVDYYGSNEYLIRLSFNSLLDQFGNNERYLELSSEEYNKFLISDNESIRYNLSLNKKEYSATFYQKTSQYEKSIKDIVELASRKKDLPDYNNELLKLTETSLIELKKCYKKSVWFKISKELSEYRIMLFYDNLYNKADGSDL